VSYVAELSVYSAMKVWRYCGILRRVCVAVGKFAAFAAQEWVRYGVQEHTYML
jgi:hypothetical protein